MYLELQTDIGTRAHNTSSYAVSTGFKKSQAKYRLFLINYEFRSKRIRFGSWADLDLTLGHFLLLFFRKCILISYYVPGTEDINRNMNEKVSLYPCRAYSPVAT